MFEKIKTKLKPLLTLNNVMLVAALILALSWAWSTISIMSRNYDLERQVQQAQLNNQISKLQNENLKLEQAYYQTNEYLELSARSLLNKANPGEHVVVLPNTNSQGVATQVTVSSNTSANESNFEQWIDFLFGRAS